MTTQPIIHSIHCRGYRGGSVGFDDSDCDCGATIISLTARLAAAEEAKLDAQDDARAQFGRYMDCDKAYRALQDRLAAAEAEIDRLRVAMASLGDWCDGSDKVSVHMRNTAWQFISASRSRVDEAAKGGRDE